jgi:hypothetical protein
MAGRIAYLGNIATQGLVLNLDAAIKGSYPGTGITWTDVSNNGNNGTLTNGPTFSSADYGSIVFDGTDDYITGSVINATTELSVFCFRNPKQRTGSVYPSLISKWDAVPGDNRSWTVGIDSANSKEYVIVSFDGTYSSTTIKRYEITGSVPYNTWTQIGFTFNNGVFTPYRNGAPAQYTASLNGTFTSIYTSSKGYNLGYSRDGIFDLYYSGSIGNAQIYNQSLTQFQVWQNFNAYKSRYGIPDIVTDGLVLNLDAGNPYSYLSGSSGTTWTNTVAVSSSLSGSLLNGARYSNGAMVFDGVDDECNLGNILFNSASATTIDMWVNIPSMAVNRYITAKGSAGDGIYTFICYTGLGPSGGGSSYIRFAMGNQSGSTSTIIEYGNLNWNQWYNFTFTYDGSFVRGYQNAVLPTSSSLSGNLYTTTSPIQLASSKYGNQAACSISNYKIYNRALSQAEITQNFNALRGRYGI